MKRSMIACLLATISVSASAAPNSTPSGYITRLSGGWVTANLRAQTDFAWTNPESCAYTDGYMIDPADSGNVLLSSMLLTAYTAGKKVQFTINGCSQGRPRIIGVDLVG